MYLFPVGVSSLSHPVSRFEDLLVLGAQLVQEGVCQLHTATPQLPYNKQKVERGGGITRVCLSSAKKNSDVTE